MVHGEESMMGSRKGLVVVLVLAVVLAGSAFLAWKPGLDRFLTRTPNDIEDYLFWQAKKLKPFQLMSADNKNFGLDDLKGKWSFVFFGYTNCPDVCPATLGILGIAFKILEKYSPDIFPEIQGIFVSVDPRRDTPESLKEYVSYFDAGFIGVTGSTGQIDGLTHQMGALYSIDNEEPGDSSYEVIHNSTIFLVDPEGRLYGRFSPPQTPEGIARTFKKIRSFYHRQDGKRS